MRPTKTLGQNFVIDGNTIRRIVAAADVWAGRDGAGSRARPRFADAWACWMPPGPWSPSKSIPCLPRVCRRPSAEWRPDAAGRTSTSCWPTRMQVTELPDGADRARGEPSLQRRRARWSCTCCSTSRSLRHGLVMVQDEVADRLAAGPGSKIYGVPSRQGRLVQQHAQGRRDRHERLLAGTQDPLRPRRVHPPGAPGHHRHPASRCSPSSMPPSPSAARRCGRRWPAGPAARREAERCLCAAGVDPTRPRRSASTLRRLPGSPKPTQAGRSVGWRKRSPEAR